MNTRSILYTIGCLATAILMYSCAGKTPAHGNKTKVAVSIPPYAYIAEAIGGDSIEVSILMEQTANPESFEPGVATMRRATDADAVILAGTLPFEQKLAAKLHEDNPQLNIVDTSHGIKLLHGTHSGCMHHHDDNEADPHVWSSIRNGRTIAHNIMQALVKADPSNADYYNQRYNAFAAHLDSLDEAITRQLETSGSKSFTVWHPSLGYYARDYNLDQISLMNGTKENTPATMKAQIDRLTQRQGNTVLFLQQGYDSQQAALLTGDPTMHVVEINPLARDWEDEITKITDAITAASPTL